jgi:acetyltransferase-like isoleucine patch superfamily enzyme
MYPVIVYFAQGICRLLPATRFFNLKRKLWRYMGVDVGNNVKLCSSARAMTTGQIRIGSDTWVGHDFLIVGGKSNVSIGRKNDIAPRVTFATGTHEILIGEEKAAGSGYSLDIDIGDGCWIGTGATILGGTKIGKCSLIAAGAVVKGNFPERCLIGGVPAKIIRRLNS